MLSLTGAFLLFHSLNSFSGSFDCRGNALRNIPFTRPTLIAANEFLADALKTHTQVNKIVLRLGLEDEVPPGNSLGIEKKVDLLGRFVFSRGADIVDTIDGKVTLVEAFVRQAVEHAAEHSQEWHQSTFIRGLARDGYVIIWGKDREPNSLRIALPEEVDLPAADDEVRLLLKHFGFRHRSVISIRPLKLTREEIGRRQTPKFGRFLRDFSMRLPSVSIRQRRGASAPQKTAAPCWQALMSVS